MVRTPIEIHSSKSRQYRNNVSLDSHNCSCHSKAIDTTKDPNSASQRSTGDQRTFLAWYFHVKHGINLTLPPHSCLRVKPQVLEQYLNHQNLKRSPVLDYIRGISKGDSVVFLLVIFDKIGKRYCFWIPTQDMISIVPPPQFKNITGLLLDLKTLISDDDCSVAWGCPEEDDFKPPKCTYVEFWGEIPLDDFCLCTAVMYEGEEFCGATEFGSPCPPCGNISRKNSILKEQVARQLGMKDLIWDPMPIDTVPLDASLF